MSEKSGNYERIKLECSLLDYLSREQLKELAKKGKRGRKSELDKVFGQANVVENCVMAMLTNESSRLPPE